MKRKDVVELYRENTSKYTKVYNFLSKTDIVLVPLLFWGVFKGSLTIDLLCSIGLYQVKKGYDFKKIKGGIYYA